MNRPQRLAAIVVAAFALAAFCDDDAAAVMSPTEITSYLTQARCPSGLPPTACTDAVPQRELDQANFGKNDWSTAKPEGYQRQDAVRREDGTILNTWQFDPWKEFTPTAGDGGEIYRIGDDGIVRVLMTRDGGTPHDQYFCGATGWVLFDNRPPTGSWKSTVARLNISKDQTSCPSLLNPAFTRWRRETLTIPFNLLGTKRDLTLSCIISEHWNGATIEAAVEMEQAIWCKGWGRIWSTAYKPTGVGLDVMRYRVPMLPWPAPPERPDFKLGDGARLQTNIQPVRGLNCRVSKFGWPPEGYRP